MFDNKMSGARAGFFKRLLALAVFCSLSPLGLSVAAELSTVDPEVTEAPAKAKSGPVAITSDRMILKNLENKILFEGHVSIKRDGLTILADHAEVLLSESSDSSSEVPGEGDSRSISEITTSGNVRVTRGRQQATAEKGVYKKGKELIVLTGNPEVWDKDFRVKGKVISFFINEERTLITESQAVIHKGIKGLETTASPK